MNNAAENPQTKSEGYGSTISMLLSSFIDYSGLHSLSQHPLQFQEAIENRLRDLGRRQLEEYRAQLSNPAFRKQEFEALVRILTIGETYFMRHPQVFSELAKLLESRLADQTHRRLRIWCAASSIGCEPYSIAILLEDLRAKYLNFDFEIFASDINSDFIAKAEAATYGRWSFRNLTDEWINTYFDPRGNEFQLKKCYRQKVNFFHHNLMDGAPLQLGSPVESLDIIFCRNVLIYFNFEIIEKLAAHFESLLAPDGLLITGPSESNIQLFNQFAVLNFKDAVFYRKKNTGELASSRYRALPSPEKQRRQLKLKPKEKPENPEITPRPQSVIDAASIREFVRKGNWTDAIKAAEKAILLDDLNSTLHLYCAYSQFMIGDSNSAELHYKKAIYLDRYSPAAHYLKTLHHKPSIPIATLKKQVTKAKEIISQFNRPIELPDQSISADEALKKLDSLLINA